MSEKYFPTIGVECHVQLCTKTKLFSEVDNDARGKSPNSCVSPVDYALPGMLPRLNQAAIELAVKAGLALNAEINLASRFDRKHYYYPDLPKGYQITQLFQPIIGAGFVELPNGTKVRIEHAHLEEDAGKLSHESDYSLVDLNRAGTPLVEIVSMPDLQSAEDARLYTKELWRLMTYAKVSFGDLYNGNMRFDINVSVSDSDKLGTRTEIKNLNSFRSVERATEYEIKRQIKLLEKGEKIVQETRGWSDATGETSSQRSKEVAADYRYMPEPDLPPIRLSAEDVAKAQAALPKMPSWYRSEFKNVLPADLLEILLDYPQLMAKLGELAAGPVASSSFSVTGALSSSKDSDPRTPEESSSKTSKENEAPPAVTIKKIANLFSSVLLAEENTSLLNDDLPSADQLRDLVAMNDNSELSSTATKEVFLKFYDPEMHYKSTHTIAKELGVVQENDLDALAQIVDEVLAKPETQKAQADFKAGEEKVIGFLVGQVMKASGGKANPASVQQILREKLSA